ncbi:radical SAM/SPASM domain-containing protein [Fusibacter sp. 3D3]|uniref:radical SAM/SPASM domain-containing protein n=1 Tax=Fusibacter sp. 3D3 TaxID=1048380 RepID=UPI001586EBAF|nr:radical SAM protein [Fusibacter sp. 3D3]
MKKDTYFILENENCKGETFFYAPLKAYCELIDNSQREESVQKHIQVISEIENATIECVHLLPPNLFLTLTNKCNLNCKYCYAGALDGEACDVTKPILKNAIDTYLTKISERHLEHCHIGFMGGREPTCAFELLKFAVNYANEIAEKAHITPTYSIVTNGFYSQEVSEFICNHIHKLSLSFDGPEFIQNFHRPAPSATDSFNRVFQNALSLKKSKVKWQIHVVVTAYNINHLEETMAFFNAHFQGTQIVFAPMDQADHKGQVMPPSPELFHEKLEQIQNRYLNAAITVERDLKTLKDYACASVSNQDWYISEKGIIETCMRSSHSKDNLFTIGYFDETEIKFKLLPQKIEALKQFDLNQQEDCQICFAKYLCGGGCPYLRNNGAWHCDLIRVYAKTAIIQQYYEKDLKRHLCALLDFDKE